MTIKPSHSPLSLIKMPGWGMAALHALPAAWRSSPPALLASPRGHLLWSVPCACRWRFSCGIGACPWSCGFDTGALLSAKTVYYTPGCSGCSSPSFLKGFSVSWEMKHVQHLPRPSWFQKALRPVLLFGFLRVGEGHENRQQGQLPLSVKTGATWASSVTFLLRCFKNQASHTKQDPRGTWIICHYPNFCKRCMREPQGCLRSLWI